MATWLFNKDECGDNYSIIDELTAENPSHEELNSIAQRIMHDNDYDCVFIGKGERVTADHVVPDWIGDDVLEEIENFAYDNICTIDDFISVTAEQRQQLNDRLYEVIVSWIEECNAIGVYYTIPKPIQFVREGKE